MANVILQGAAWAEVPGLPEASPLRSLKLAEGGPGGPVLAAASAAGGGVAAISAGTGGTLAFEDLRAYPAAGGLSGVQLAEISIGGQQHLLPLGREIGAAFAYALDSGGSLGAADAIDPMGLLKQENSGAVTAALGLSGSGSVQLLTASGSGLYSWRIDAAGTAQSAHLALPGSGGQIADMIQTASGAVITADILNHRLQSYTVSAGGTLSARDSFSAAAGGGITAPSALEGLSAGGQSYAIAASAGSSSLTVLWSGSSGSLTPADHLIDTGTSYFGGAAHLAAAAWGSWNLLAAAGNDGGVSLFALLEGGLLSPLSHTAWQSVPGGPAAMAALSGLEAYASGSLLNVYAAPEGSRGLQHLAFDLSALGGCYTGNIAGSAVTGSQKDDILLAGAAGQALGGGQGEDTFVFTSAIAGGDGSLGRITDFTPGTDRIDLTALPLLRAPDQVAVLGGGSGTELRFAGYSLLLDGVSAEDFDAARDLQFDADRILPAQLSIPDDGVLYGTPGEDVLKVDAGDGVLYGDDGNDRLLGGAGNDSMDGGNGSDTLNGGAGNDTITGGSYSADLRDTVYAGAGDDWIDGGYGNDLLYGQEGNDTITGGWGADELIGQAGDDVLNGAVYSDLLYGGEGADFVNGGFGHDRINGGGGADSFYHLGIADHGSDWIQDYASAEGDVLLFGQAGAGAGDFQVNYAHTADAEGERAGDDGVAEAFVIHRPSGQIIWALVDGAAEDSLLLRIAGEGGVYDLL
jgi:hypothetical protein